MDPAYASTDVYSLNVVFHLLDEASTLSDALIERQIIALNAAFRGTALAEPRALDVRIEFFLAHTVRYPSCFPELPWDAEFALWDPHRFVNVVVYELVDDGFVELLPADHDGRYVGTVVDIVHLDREALGPSGISTRPGNEGKTLVHELGHYLGLHHPFEQGCTDPAAPQCFYTGDLLCDTPPQPHASPGGDCDRQPDCFGNATAATNFIDTAAANFMDTAADRCRRTFTPQQAQRMRCTLLHYRASLLAPRCSAP